MDDELTVVCLCAAWCGVCRDYALPFRQASLAFGRQATFTQLDIEDEAELLGSVDVENFPTLLIARSGRALFFGPVTPHVQTLMRLVQRGLAGELTLLANAPEIDALAQRVHAALAVSERRPAP